MEPLNISKQRNPNTSTPCTVLTFQLQLNFIQYFLIIAIIINYRYFLHKNSVGVPNSENWNKAINYIQANNPNTSYLSPHFANIAIENSWPIYDNGQTEYFVYSQISTNQAKLLGDIFPQALLVRHHFIMWQNELNQKVEDKYFSIIAIQKNNYPLIDEQNLINNYYLDYKIDLPINLKNIYFWKPI